MRLEETMTFKKDKLVIGNIWDRSMTLRHPKLC